MALKFMRDQAKSFWVKFLLYAVALSFIIGFGAFSYLGKASRTNAADQWVIKVNDKTITRQQYMRAVKNLKERITRQYGENAEAYLKFMNPEMMALQQIISESVLSEEAVQKGIVVSDEELRKAISMMGGFYNRNGQFDRQLYIKTLRRYQLTPTEFEALQREGMAAQNLQYLVRTSAKVTEAELWEYFLQTNDRASVKFFKFTNDAVNNNIEVTEDDANAYFEKNKAEFKMPETRKVDYVSFTKEQFSDQVQISEDDIVSYYDKNKDRLFKVEEQVNGRHILIKASPEDPQPVKDAARKLAEKVQAMAAAEGADFAALAAKYSQDEGSKDKGGSLGWFDKSRMVPSFSEAAFALELGEVSSVVESMYGYHVIKVDDRKEGGYKSVLEVSDLIKNSLNNEKALELAMDRARDAYNELKAGDKLTDYAKGKDLTFGTSEFFERSKGIQGLDGGRRASLEAFKLKELEISQPFKGNSTVYLFQIAETAPEREPEFEEVKDKAMELAKKDAIKGAVDALAEKARQEIIAGADPVKVANKNGLKVESSGMFTLASYGVPKLGPAAGLVQEAFQLTEENPVASKVYNGAVVWLDEREKATRSAFEAKKAEIRQQLLQMREQELYGAWIQAAMERAKVEQDPEFFAQFKKDTPGLNF